MKTDLRDLSLSIRFKNYQIVPSAAALEQCFGFARYILPCIICNCAEIVKTNYNHAL